MGKKRPSRDKLLALGISMGLELEEMRRLLKVADCGDLYPRIQRDPIIIYCLEKKLELIETNNLLHEMNEYIIE